MLLSILISDGAIINSKDSQGATPLHTTCQSKNSQSLSILRWNTATLDEESYSKHFYV